MRSSGAALAVWLALVAVTAHAAPAPPVGAIQLDLDATLAAQHTFHSRLAIPAVPGPLTLLYPKWIPGYHSPSGPVGGVAGLSVTANGAALEWRRDLDDMYALHLVVPNGVTGIVVEFDMVTFADDSRATTSAKLALLQWNQFLFYPAGRPTDSIRVAASLRPPAGWNCATALPRAGERAGSIRFAEASLTTLVDSPVQLGAFTRTIPLNPGDPRPVFVDLAADSPAATDLDSAYVRHWRALVREAGALFGARHYRDFHFLMTLSDHVEGDGIEHHESTDIRDEESTLTDPEHSLDASRTLCHEYAHSWNGKYRRPKDQMTTDYQQPLAGDLLWIYEGLTEFLAELLAARSGFQTPAQFREELALIAGRLEARPGREWRPLLDTGVEAQLLYDTPYAGQAWRRTTEFYDEGSLIWLEVDSILRRESHGSRSIDDFCRAFHGGASGPPAVLPYTLDDVVAALDAIVPHDWRGLFRERVERIQSRVPVGGVEGEGWRLVYRDSSSRYLDARASVAGQVDLRWSIGVVLGAKDGAIRDVVPGSPAAKAGIAPGSRLVAVNGRAWTRDNLHAAVAATANAKPLELLVESNDFYTSRLIAWTGGERYPWLERIPGTKDALTPLITSRAH